MDCEFQYCIHNINFKCRYQTISINSYGSCTECMIVAIQEDELEALKHVQRKQFTQRPTYG